jgi:outer membrane receptor protein involved in Fe transport
MPWLGDSSMAVDIGRSGLGRFGTLSKRSASFEWRMVEWLQFVASTVRDERAIVPELLAAPQVISANVPYFDPLTGQTSDVTLISGGAAGLKNEESRTRTLSLTANPLPKYALQLDADYVVTELRNQIGALPLPSPAVVAAFPDRFQRDATGTLVLVDNRTVNFARQSGKQIRLGARFVVPLITPPRPVKGRLGHRPPPPLKLQVNASHTIVLKNTTVIRDGLPQVDLLEGGAIGTGGGVQRHSTNGSIALTRGKSGILVEARRRGANSLVIGTAGAPDLLMFNPLTTIDLKAYADLGQLFASTRVVKDTRISLAFDNITNRRQRVTDRSGEIPQAYQPVRRDPVGRTVMLELRKVF